MLSPFPEPAADIAAQIAAVLDPDHPKRAAFVPPGNEVPPLASDAIVVTRPEGALVTTDARLAAMFEAAVDDATMALILGYPEHKEDVLRNCGGQWSAVIAVQARDAKGNVITDAIASPAGAEQTVAALALHVPEGGELVVITPVEMINRRLALRALEIA
jgi:hypothetical protein